MFYTNFPLYTIKINHAKIFNAHKKIFRIENNIKKNVKMGKIYHAYHFLQVHKFKANNFHNIVN